ADELESAVHHRVALARHDSHRVTALIEEGKGVDHALVSRHQAVVMLHLERAIAVDQPLSVLVGLDVRSELLWQRSAYSFDPLTVAGLAGAALERVPHRGQQEGDGID